MSSAGFPPIDSVPPRPVLSGDNSAQSRLTTSKTNLENERASALEKKDALTRDVAAEPSMLSDLPKTDGVVPPNDPVGVTPAAPVAPSVNPAPAPLTPAVVVPRSGALAPSSSLTMPPPSLPTAAAVQAAPAAPPLVVANVNPPPAMRPIILKRPAPALPPLKAPASADGSANAGDFDPLAVADTAPVATSMGVITLQRPSMTDARYIAQSRYADRR